MSTNCTVTAVLFALMLGTLPGVTAQQSDTIAFARARAALAAKDCSAAIKALESVSAVRKADPLWLSSASDAYECAGDLDTALRHFAKYAEMFPADPEVLKRLGDLSYRADKAATERGAAKEQARWATDPSGDWVLWELGAPVPDTRVRATRTSAGVRFTYTQTPAGHSGAGDVLFEGKLSPVSASDPPAYVGEVYLELISIWYPGAPQIQGNVEYDTNLPLRGTGRGYFGVLPQLVGSVPGGLLRRKAYAAMGQLTRAFNEKPQGVQFFIDRADGSCCGIRVDSWQNNAPTTSSSSVAVDLRRAQ